MQRKNYLIQKQSRSATFGAMLMATLVVPAMSYAQKSDTEEVVVTGSRIKRISQSDSATPINSYGQSEFADAGIKDSRDLIETLTINTGSQNNSDNLSQNFTAGTSNMNLRGLGVSATLVLLNGRRQVTSSVVTDEGASFVDTASLIPSLAIERVEILKDGASAIYGSDAVAGVANFITRDNFNGLELAFEQRARTGAGSQEDAYVDLVLGGDFGDSGHLLLAASYLDRSSLTLNEVDWLTPNGLSSFGHPGNFATSAGTVPDPNCVENGNTISAANGQCLFDFGPQITVVPDEQRLQGFARAVWDWSDTTQLWTEIGYARNKISREVSPSFPVLNAPVVLADHPDNPYGEDVFFRGRPFGAGKPTETNFYDHSTTRFATGLEGEFSENLFWELAYVSAANDAILNPRDVIAPNFQAALLGFGGKNCNSRDPADAGQGECLYFNPWSPAPGQAESPANEELRSFIIGDYIGDTESELRAIEGVISGNNLFSMGGGDAGFALGFQYREESLKAIYDSITQQDQWAFLIGNQNFSGETDLFGVFAELLLPISPSFEASFALRYEDYGDGIGDTTNPKLALLWQPMDSLAFRASGSSSFRAPSVHQLQGAQTNFTNITDPVDGSSTFGGNRTIGDPNLKPETSTAFNIGASIAAGDWDIDVDYWRFSFEDVLTRENAQQIVDQYWDDPDVETRNSRIERTQAGTITIVNTFFINANAIDTSGVDFSAKTDYDTTLGSFSPSFDATYILAYDVEDNTGNVTDGAGSLNRDNIGNPTPELRANAGLRWSHKQHSANVFYRYVDSYTNDQNNDSIDAFGTIDLQYSLGLGDFLRSGSETTLTIGLLNAADEAPPFVAISGSYDPRVGDPRGRRAYIRVGATF